MVAQLGELSRRAHQLGSIRRGPGSAEIYTPETIHPTQQLLDDIGQLQPDVVRVRRYNEVFYRSQTLAAKLIAATSNSEYPFLGHAIEPLQLTPNDVVIITADQPLSQKDPQGPYPGKLYLGVASRENHNSIYFDDNYHILEVNRHDGHTKLDPGNVIVSYEGYLPDLLNVMRTDLQEARENFSGQMTQSRTAFEGEAAKKNEFVPQAIKHVIDGFAHAFPDQDFVVFGMPDDHFHFFRQDGSNRVVLGTNLLLTEENFLRYANNKVYPDSKYERPARGTGLIVERYSHHGGFTTEIEMVTPESRLGTYLRAPRYNDTVDLGSHGLVEKNFGAFLEGAQFPPYFPHHTVGEQPILLYAHPNQSPTEPVFRKS